MAKNSHKGFQSLLYFKFQFTKQHRVDETASKMGISPTTLYGYTEGRNTFPVDLLPRLFNATQDPDFFQFVTNDTDYMAVPRAEVQQKDRSLEREAMDTAVVAGKLLDNLEECLSDGNIDELEQKRLLKIANDGLKEFQEFIHRLEAGKGSKPGEAVS